MTEADVAIWFVYLVTYLGLTLVVGVYHALRIETEDEYLAAYRSVVLELAAALTSGPDSFGTKANPDP